MAPSQRRSRRGGARPGSGRPEGSRIAIERDPQRFEIASWWALFEEGVGPFDAARRAKLAVKGGAFSMEEIEGLLRVASAEIPLPRHNPDEPDAGLRRLAAKARRVVQHPSLWLVHSVGTLRALIHFIRENNEPGICAMLDALVALGWRPVILGLARRIEDALGSNLPPADVERLEKLSPAARRWLAELRGR